jgi:hypothetical protein
MTIEAMKQALEALEQWTTPHWAGTGVDKANAAYATLRTAIEQAEKPKYDSIELHVLHSHIAGVLFDFMGWLTSREKRLTLSSTDEAGPAVEAITEFAKMRGLSLQDAQVEHWQAILTTKPAAQPEPVQEHEPENEPFVSLASVQEFVCSTGLCHYKAQRPWVGLEPKDMTALVEQARQVPKEVPCPDYNERLLTLADAKLREKNAA